MAQDYTTFITRLQFVNKLSNINGINNINILTNIFTTETIVEHYKNLLTECFNPNININLVYAEYIIGELIKFNINPIDEIIKIFNEFATNLSNNFKIVTSPNTASNFINSYNIYFSAAKKIRCILRKFNNNFEVTMKKDIIYILSNYIFYKIIFDKDYVINNIKYSGYQYLIKYFNNFNATEVIDVMRILYHYVNFVKYFDISDLVNFSKINIILDFTNIKLDYVIDEICTIVNKNIIELNNLYEIKDDKDKKIKLSENIINNIKIYTNLEPLNSKFCDGYIKHLFNRCLNNNINIDIEKILVKAFDVITDNKYLNLIRDTINYKERTNEFNNYVKNYDKNQIKITQDKFANLTIPELSSIYVNIINNNIKKQDFNLNSPSLELYLKLISSLYDNFTMNTKYLTYDFENSFMNFVITTDKEYTFTCNLIQYIIIDYINNNSEMNITIDDISKYINMDATVFIDTLLNSKIIKYKEDYVNTNITFTLDELNNLVNSLNIVSEIKTLINSKIIKTRYLIINTDFKNNITNIDLVKIYDELIHVKEMLNYQEDILTNVNTENKVEIENNDENVIIEEIIEYVEDDGNYIDGEEVIEIIEEVYEDEEIEESEDCNT